jgi:anthranilate/para-aminobenzoate synthase component II
MILLVDSYDSFTWNLWQGFAGLGSTCASYAP